MIIALVNQSLDEDLDVKIILAGGERGIRRNMTVLNAGNIRTYNDFDFPENVKIREEPLAVRGENI